MKQYQITAFSKDSESFEMQIIAPENILFSELHQAIQSALEYDPLQMASFFLSNAYWEKEEEITLIDMEDQGKAQLMEDLRLSDKILKVDQKLLYLFDFFSERLFFMNVDEVTEPKEATFSINVQGEIPLQINIDSEGIDDLMSDMADTAKKEAFDEFGGDVDGDFGEEGISFENIDDLDDY